jgi:phosphoserine aminotransferase
MNDRVFNFYAGPTALPPSVLAAIERDLFNFRGTGMSVMEISHRAPEIEFLLADTAERARRLLGLDAGTEVLLLQGGGSLQFCMIPMNFSAPGDPVDYLDTGYWAQKSIREAQAVHRDVAIAASSADQGHTYVPDAASIQARPGARYCHLISNNTVEGTQFHQLPDTGVPLIADMSSDLMSAPFDPDSCVMAYAHTQKNIGIAGVTLVLARRSWLDGIPDGLPAILDYRTHSAHRSNYHTPPTFAIYVTWLMLDWLEREIGGLAAMGAINRQKASTLYSYLDAAAFYGCPVQPASRSLMNVVFTLPSAELLAEFLAAADQEGLAGLAGHRSIGGCRASLFNGVTQESVDHLVRFLDAFAGRHQPVRPRLRGTRAVSPSQPASPAQAISPAQPVNA